MKVSEAQAIAREEHAAYTMMLAAIRRFERARRAYLDMPLLFEPEDEDT